MTREQAKELLTIIQAFSEGKTIQYKNSEGEWEDAAFEENLTFIDAPSKYRIKPEPTYRPFRTKEECWDELSKHQPFGWVKNKDAQYINLLSVGDNKDLNYWFTVYNFIDGTPFGIKEE